MSSLTNSTKENATDASNVFECGTFFPRSGISLQVNMDYFFRKKVSIFFRWTKWMIENGTHGSKYTYKILNIFFRRNTQKIAKTFLVVFKCTQNQGKQNNNADAYNVFYKKKYHHNHKC